MAEGNTKPLPQNKRYRKWVATLNNYSNNEVKTLEEFFTQKTAKFIIGKEVGEEKTPHLQIYMEFKNAVSFQRLKKLNDRLHLEKAKGSREQNINYCSKENNFLSNFLQFKMLNEYEKTEWKEWQKEILNLLEKKPDNRSIHWYYDEVGNSGKSYLTKYIYLKYKCIITNGKAQDSFNQIKTAMDKDEEPNIVIMDIPRCMKNFISFQAIEKIKDGLFYSGKYEGGICCYPPPHIIIFSNEEPELDNLSMDRWKIKKIT